MTVTDHVDVAAGLAPPGVSPPRPVRLCFRGRIGDYWRLMIRGAILQAVTLGVYRFWLFTDMRRFLWAGTEILGETPEYTGTASELLIGFMIAIGILIPVYALFFVASLEFGILSDLSGVVAFVVLAGFGEYAAYRARRYRLTRTVFRGLRFHQSGSAIRYAVRAMLWWFPVVLTLGLAWPWAVANLERYKMRNTFYGDLGGGFAGSGTALFWRGFLIWLLVIGPIVAAPVGALAVVDWAAVADVLDSAAADVLDNDDLQSAINVILESNSGIHLLLRLLVVGVTSSMLMGGVLYPAYQAIVMRWWLGGLRLGGAAAASDLHVGRYYGPYLRYLLYLMLFTIAFIVAAVLVSPGITTLMRGRIDLPRTSMLRDGLMAGAAVAAYMSYFLGTYTIFQVVVKLRLWRAAVESTLIAGYAVFDNVRASEAASSALGEGLADALGGGGI